jgi:hypothetical protein
MKLFICISIMLTCIFHLGLISSWAETGTAGAEPSSDTTAIALSNSVAANSEFNPTLPMERSKLRGASNKIKNDITNEPLGLLAGTATLRYERMISRNTSLVAGLKFAWLANYNMSTGDQIRTIIGAEGAFRFFPLEKFCAPRGLWFGPTVEFINSYYNEAGKSLMNVNMLAEVGWKFISGDRVGFVVSPYIGVGYSWGMGGPIMNRYNGDLLAPYSGLTAVIGCELGMGF